MNCYEHTFIAKQDLSENLIKKLIEKYENIINKNQGKILKTENWGLRNLSYEISKNRKGIYYHIKFEGTGKTIEELERMSPCQPNSKDIPALLQARPPFGEQCLLDERRHR